MWVPPVYLDADGLDRFTFNTAGVKIDALDFGRPEIRTVTEPFPDADGEIDSTLLVGSRVVTLQLHLSTPDWATVQALKQFLSPRRRPTLVFQIAEDAPEQQVGPLRVSNWSDTFDTGYVFAGQQPMVVQWVAPYGLIESFELHTETAAASGAGTETGLVAPVVAPIVLAAAEVDGAVEVDNAGTAHAYPVIRLYGPSSDGGVLSNDETGLQLVFGAGLDILVGEFVEIDFRAKTIRYNGLASDSRYDTLDFATSQWWTLQPGLQRIRWAPTSFDSPAQAVIEWRDAWL